ncbi:carboxylesterase family protein [Rhodococcus sp. X156]|uniref:carboxylesterase family protein n=1 Tax=Rhodococcus sp. X156 TaxID=2499145 RepID=UPI000FDA695B|nr:carboxylesterase family protein [Rhodococcus sp. X156]
MAHEVSTSAGTLRGTPERGCVLFRGVPYAAAERFGRPQPVPPWSGVREPTGGPVPPQLPSSLEVVIGSPEPRPQAEDCLNLTVTVPDREGSGRPVLVWVPGGGYDVGAGTWDMYDGVRLSTAADAVVVSVTYRLGALGFLRSPGLSEGNLAVWDVVAALQWVQANAAAFGGDPERVTVAGQSAGAHLIAVLLGMAETEGLFTSAILQSPPLGLGLDRAEHAAETGARFLEALATDPRTAPVSAVLDAQERVINAAGSEGLLFLPIAGAGGVPDEEQLRRQVQARAAGLRVLTGLVAEELNQPAYAQPLQSFVELLTGAGAQVYRYLSRTSAPASPYGAVHCSELPFLVGTERAWAGAAMLAGWSWADVQRVGAPYLAAWAAFVRGEQPEVGGAPWAPLSAEGDGVAEL